MQALRTLCGLVFGLAIAVAALADLHSGHMGEVARAALAHLLQPRAAIAEVVVAFDHAGRVETSSLRRSSGSRLTDQRALNAAVELASLQAPEAVAGRTVLIRARFHQTPADG